MPITVCQLGESDDYLGLCPESPLFLNPYGVAYVLRRTEANGRVRHRCRGIQETLRQLFRHAGRPTLSSRDARRTVAGSARIWTRTRSGSTSN